MSEGEREAMRNALRSAWDNSPIGFGFDAMTDVALAARPASSPTRDEIGRVAKAIWPEAFAGDSAGWNQRRDVARQQARAAIEAMDRPASNEVRVVSDADWKRAIECAFLCLSNVSITRAELDNAMQHAFGILSLAALAAEPGESKGD